MLPPSNYLPYRPNVSCNGTHLVCWKSKVTQCYMRLFMPLLAALSTKTYTEKNSAEWRSNAVSVNRRVTYLLAYFLRATYSAAAVKYDGLLAQSYACTCWPRAVLTSYIRQIVENQRTPPIVDQNPFTVGVDTSHWTRNKTSYFGSCSGFTSQQAGASYAWIVRISQGHSIYQVWTL